MSGMHAELPSQFVAAVTVHADPSVSMGWFSKHVPQGVVGPSVDGFAHSAVHLLAHGADAPAHAQAWSSSASKAWAAAGFFAMQIAVHDPASAAAPPVPAPPVPLDVLELLEVLLELVVLELLAVVELVVPLWDDVDAPVPLELRVTGEVELHA
jgi:hypothetical protein